MLEKLFESLDEKVFTNDLKESLETSFNEAVELKAIELAESKISEKTELLKEEMDNFKEDLVELAEKRESKILEQVDSYLEKVVDEFVTEAEEKLSETIVNEKADLMIEAFDSMLIAGGVDIQKIVEAKETSDIENKLEESIEKYDELVEENIELRKKEEELLKLGVIAEMQSDLSIIESSKFAKLAELVEFSKDSSYIEKLETIKESVQKTVVESVNENIVTNVQPKSTKINEDFSRFI
jgi:hypothetical protein